MIILPAIDIYDQKVVRLYQGDYGQMHVYAENPLLPASAFARQGARHLHVVDLNAAKGLPSPNIALIQELVRSSGLEVELGGGLRHMEILEQYAGCGVQRLIIGTAALTDTAFLRAALRRYGEKIALGVDIRDGRIAIQGWTKHANISLHSFLEEMQNLGVKTIICTDISKDGALQGSNTALYRDLAARYRMRLIASGGISSPEDIRQLKDIGIYGAIIGKACYTGAIDLAEAIEVAK